MLLAIIFVDNFEERRVFIAMTTQKLSIGILAPMAEIRDSITGHVESTQLGSVKLIVDEYCLVEDDYATQRFIEARPDIIFVDMQDPRSEYQLTLYSACRAPRCMALRLWPL